MHRLSSGSRYAIAGEETPERRWPQNVGRPRKVHRPVVTVRRRDKPAPGRRCVSSMTVPQPAVKVFSASTAETWRQAASATPRRDRSPGHFVNIGDARAAGRRWAVSAFRHFRPAGGLSFACYCPSFGHAPAEGGAEFAGLFAFGCSVEYAAHLLGPGSEEIVASLSMYKAAMSAPSRALPEAQALNGTIKRMQCCGAGSLNSTVSCP